MNNRKSNLICVWRPADLSGLPLVCAWIEVDSERLAAPELGDWGVLQDAAGSPIFWMRKQKRIEDPENARRNFACEINAGSTRGSAHTPHPIDPIDGEKRLYIAPTGR
jgi:hypothetical protein